MKSFCQHWLKALAVFLSVFFCLNSYSQTKTVTGRVTDSSNAGLAGVTVSAKGAGTSTNEDGRFTIKVPVSTNALRFSYVGFEPQTVSIANKPEVNVTLRNVATSMNEVVVVGYGTQKKSDVTGALTRISAEDIQERPNQNLLQAVQGKAAGVQVSSNIKPGELPVVRIRGNRSLGASNDPLYVVDGIPIVNALGVSSFSISDLNPNDIASMEILKDASATAIYGSRGANGVIIITTNKGKKGRASLSFNSTVSLDSYKSLTDWMDGGEYVDRWRLALMNGRQYNSTTNSNLYQPATLSYPDPFIDRDKMNLAADRTALQSVWRGYEWDVFGVTPKFVRQQQKNRQWAGLQWCLFTTLEM